jgi:Protein of unknown function (DUF5818)
MMRSWRDIAITLIDGSSSEIASFRRLSLPRTLVVTWLAKSFAEHFAPVWSSLRSAKSPTPPDGAPFQGLKVSALVWQRSCTSAACEQKSLPKELAMKKSRHTVSTMLPLVALTAAFLCSGQLTRAQNAPSQSTPTTQTQGMQPDEQGAAQKTFTGKIVKVGDKLVLSDAASKTSYQLDDQMKAQDFLNKSVKVTGVLDPSTGTIRVSAIDPV